MARIRNKELWLFEDYANKSFRDTPNNLIKFVDTTSDFLSLKIVPRDLFRSDEINIPWQKMMAKNVLELIRDNEIKIQLAGGDTITAKIGLNNDHSIDEIILDQYKINISWARYINAVFEAAYGGKEGREICQRCDPVLKEKRHELLGKDVFRNFNEIRCYECDQLYFARIVEDIVNGGELSQNWGLRYFIAYVNKFMKTESQFTILRNENGRSSMKYEHRNVMEILLADGHFQGSFRNYLICAATYSLADFLSTMDRRLLKQCPHCLEYYVATDIRRQKCYKEACEREYQRIKKERQRDADPETYL